MTIETAGMKTTHIAAVKDKGTPTREWWLVTDVDGAQYATRNMWHAALCERAQQGGLPVRLWSSAGWHYRDLDEVRLVDESCRMARATHR